MLPAGMEIDIWMIPYTDIKPAYSKAAFHIHDEFLQNLSVKENCQ